MDVQPTNLQKLCDAIMSIWSKISEECFQHLVESMPRRIKAVLKAKGDTTRCKQCVPNKVASECKYSFIVLFKLHFYTDLILFYLIFNICFECNYEIDNVIMGSYHFLTQNYLVPGPVNLTDGPVGIHSSQSCIRFRLVCELGFDWCVTQTRLYLFWNVWPAPFPY